MACFAGLVSKIPINETAETHPQSPAALVAELVSMGDSSRPDRPEVFSFPPSAPSLLSRHER